MKGGISKSFISHLLVRVDIVNIINERVQLKKKGQNFMACCPFHNEKSPSFSVSQSKQIYHCFGCGVSGDAIAFLMEFERLSFVETIEYLASSIGAEVIYEQGHKPKSVSNIENTFSIMQSVAKYYQTCLFKNPDAKNYLNNRGLSKEVIALYQLGFAEDKWQQVEHVVNKDPLAQSILIQAGMLIEKQSTQRTYDRFRNRIMFPIKNPRGQIIGFGGRALGDDNPKYLNSPETPYFHKGNELYGLFEAKEAIRNQNTILIVEGYMDVIALAQFGIKHAVATLGTAATPEHIKRLLRHADNIIFCFDGDAAGKQAAWKALENALAFAHEGINIRFAFLPEGEDPDTVCRQLGKETFLTFMDQSLSLSDFFIQKMTQTFPIDTIEGKSKLSNFCKPLLKKITPGVFQALLAKKIAHILNFDEISFLDTMEIKTQKTHQQFSSKYKAANHYQTPSPIRHAIAILLNEPCLAQEVKDFEFLNNPTNQGQYLLYELLQYCQSHTSINTASLIQAFNDHPQASALKKLAARELFYIENGLKQEFLDIILHLKQESQNQGMEQLMAKANISGLTDEERLQLQKMIKDKHHT